MNTRIWVADRLLKDILPLHLWRMLARHEITTLEQLESLYPEKLWRMHYVGKISFRQLEQYLFPGKHYEPAAPESPERRVLEDGSLDGLVSARVLRTLRRNGIETVRQLRAAYPERLKQLSGFGKTAMQEVEGAFQVLPPAEPRRRN